jgi:16S rRNA C1402 N4-methylase RsmH
MRTIKLQKQTCKRWQNETLTAITQTFYPVAKEQKDFNKITKRTFFTLKITVNQENPLEIIKEMINKNKTHMQIHSL